MPNITVKSIVSGDIETIRKYAKILWKIEEDCFEQDLLYTYSSFFDKLVQKNVIVIEADDEVAGFLVYQKNPLNLHVQQIAVPPRHQRSGIGTLLMKEVEKHADKNNASVVLESRPFNEPFYRKLGFKPKAVDLTYYEYDNDAIKVPGISMEKKARVDATKPPSQHTNPNSFWYTPSDSVPYESNRQLLLTLTGIVKSSTSSWYGGFFAALFGRSRRKEEAFETILLELSALGSKETKIRTLNPHKVLQSIVHNCLIIRGFGILSSETTSGQALLQSLNNNPLFAPLKALVSAEKKTLSYADLMKFAELEKHPHSSSTPVPYSPYHYF